MNFREAKRRVLHGAATILDDGGFNTWLSQDLDGSALSEEDEERMQRAFRELVDELRERAGRLNYKKV